MAKKKTDKKVVKIPDSPIEETPFEFPKEASVAFKKEIVEPTKKEQAPTSGAVPLRAFVTASGKKWDQLAGFGQYARKMKMAPRSMSAWREEYQAFMNRPVR